MRAVSIERREEKRRGEERREEKRREEKRRERASVSMLHSQIESGRGLGPSYLSDGAEGCIYAYLCANLQVVVVVSLQSIAVGRAVDVCVRACVRARVRCDDGDGPLLRLYSNLYLSFIKEQKREGEMGVRQPDIYHSSCNESTFQPFLKKVD